jgi:hypothetical protein
VGRGSRQQGPDGTRRPVVSGGDAGCTVAEAEQSQRESRCGPALATYVTMSDE